jgi:hypothetical protein
VRAVVGHVQREEVGRQHVEGRRGDLQRRCCRCRYPGLHD